jgi:hypothetical protein
VNKRQNVKGEEGKDIDKNDSEEDGKDRKQGKE